MQPSHNRHRQSILMHGTSFLWIERGFAERYSGPDDPKVLLKSSHSLFQKKLVRCAVTASKGLLIRYISPVNEANPVDKTYMSNRLPKIDISTEEPEGQNICIITCHYDYGQRPLVVSSGSNDIESAPCAITPKLSEMAPRTPFKVQEISFTSLSRDQGWGGESHVRGIYEGSWTWLGAQIIKDTDILEEPDSPTAADAEAQKQINTVNDLVNTRSLPGHKDVWTIQQNRRANREYYEHTVTWKRGDQVQPDGYMLQTGRGENRGFVEALDMDDRIAVVAQAMFMAWENMVKFVTLRITCEFE